MLALLAGGWYFAAWRPIGTPTLSPSAASYAASNEATATEKSAVTPVPPSPVGQLLSSTGTATATATAGRPPAGASSSLASGLDAPAVASGRPCRPVRFAMTALGIDTSVVALSLTSGGDLGTPSDGDKKSAGWFPSVLAGAARGTVLMDGHTYHDGSALFTLGFARQVRTGMVMRLSCADGHAFSYRLSEITLDVSPASYPGFVTSRALYSADGPAQLVIITCTDYIPAQRVWAHRAILIATPVD